MLFDTNSRFTYTELAVPKGERSLALLITSVPAPTKGVTSPDALPILVSRKRAAASTSRSFRWKAPFSNSTLSASPARSAEPAFYDAFACRSRGTGASRVGFLPPLQPRQDWRDDRPPQRRQRDNFRQALGDRSRPRIASVWRAQIIREGTDRPLE